MVKYDSMAGVGGVPLNTFFEAKNAESFDEGLEFLTRV
jgi:hypothetical protein